MATKRRKKQWWQMLRGPRGHRGLPGPPNIIDYSDVIYGLNEKISLLSIRVTDLERKLGGSQK